MARLAAMGLLVEGQPPPGAQAAGHPAGTAQLRVREERAVAVTAQPGAARAEAIPVAAAAGVAPAAVVAAPAGVGVAPAVAEGVVAEGVSAC